VFIINKLAGVPVKRFNPPPSVPIQNFYPNLHKCL
jgi:hypothetical protein